MKTGLGAHHVILKKVDVDTRGKNWGALHVRGDTFCFALLIYIGKTSIEFVSETGLSFEVPLTEIAQAIVQPRGNEIAVEFHTDDTKVEDEVVEMRFVIPNSGARAVIGAPESDGDLSTAQVCDDSYTCGLL